MRPTETIPLFDDYLAKQHLSFEAVVIGGAALALLGIIGRETRDFDIIEPLLPEAVAEASRSFAAERSGKGEVLRRDWLNNGPALLARLLPSGWRTRLQLAFKGRAITLWSPGRPDFLLTKLFALCDRGLDLSDCVAMAPTAAELAAAADWVVLQDMNPEWPAHVQATLRDLGRRCGHGL